MGSIVTQAKATRPRAAALLEWYDRCRRDLPWRAAPGAVPDAYRVWLSEVMLQQTTVAAVIPYYLRFCELWPTVTALANADLEDVLKHWAGLGYYARARNMHACARAVRDRHGGRFPDTVPELMKLPGIGPYTAGAIAAIAFDKPAIAIDGNVERVISRAFAVRGELPAIKPEIATLTETLLPRDRPGDFAQALMDLGATLCKPREPDCGSCPWIGSCQGRALGIAADLPRKGRKKPRPVRHGVAFWIERGDGCVLLRRRPETGLLGGMIEVPSTPWQREPCADPAASAPIAAPRWRRRPGTVEHTFTHFHLVMTVWCASVADDAEPAAEGDWRWVTRENLTGEALPTLMKKVAAHATGAQPADTPRRQAP